MDILVVVDMQNDFISDALGTTEATLIVSKVAEKIKSFDGKVIFTRDTHGTDYLSTQEGKNLPVEHCIEGTKGWEIHSELETLRTEPAFDKPSFGSIEFSLMLRELDKKEHIDSLCFIGLCTDICVLSNAIIAKAALPEVPVYVDASCCAGVTPESHKTALAAMKPCQIQVINE